MNCFERKGHCLERKGTCYRFGFTITDDVSQIQDTHIRVCTGFGFVMQFSSTWKVLQKDRFFKLAVKSLRLLVWGKSKVSLNG